MKTKALSLLFVLSILFTMQTKAQLYKTAAGIRLGSTATMIDNGITVKHFLDASSAIEGILSVGDGFGIAGLYELHKPLSVENLQWFIGGGGYVGAIKRVTMVGATGIVGLDYKFAQFPVNISLDWKPEINFIPGVAFEGSAVGFSARFVF